MRLIGLLAVCLFTALGQEPSTPKQRIRSVRDLVKQGSPAIAKIQPYLKDDDVDVRREAVKALVEIGTQRSLDPLISALKDEDAEVKVRATDGLVNFYLPGYVQTGLSAQLKRAGSLVGAAFNDTSELAVEPDVRVRPEIISGLAAVLGGGSMLPVRANCARALGALRGRAALPQLLEALRSKNDQLIYESLIALQKIGEPSAGPRVVFLLRDLDERVQLAAIETAGLLRTQDALPSLRRVVESTDNKKVKRQALAAVAMIPNLANRPLLEQYAADKDEGLRAAAAEGLGRLAKPQDAEALAKSFEEEKKMAPRLAFAFAVCSAGRVDSDEFGALRYLLNTLNTKAWRNVSFAYLEELARQPQFCAKLIPVLQSGTREEKTAVVAILGRTGGPEVIPALEALSKNPDADLAQQAVRALRVARSRNP
jgi:HEAT repeat protein